MTLKYFRMLSESKQYNRLLVKGVYVAECMFHDAQRLLFQMDTFYVEVAFHSETDEIVCVRSFEDWGELDPYLDSINISEVFF